MKPGARDRDRDRNGDRDRDRDSLQVCSARHATARATRADALFRSCLAFPENTTSIIDSRSSVIFITCLALFLKAVTNSTSPSSKGRAPLTLSARLASRAPRRGQDREARDGCGWVGAARGSAPPPRPLLNPKPLRQKGSEMRLDDPHRWQWRAGEK